VTVLCGSLALRRAARANVWVGVPRGHDDNGGQHLFVFDSSDHSRVPIEAHLDGSAAGRWMPPFFSGSLAVNQRGDLAALGAAPNPDVANGFHQHRIGSGAAARFRHRENGADFATH
jgi:hypothetical protein